MGYENSSLINEHSRTEKQEVTTTHQCDLHPSCLENGSKKYSKERLTFTQTMYLHSLNNEIELNLQFSSQSSRVH